MDTVFLTVVSLFGAIALFLLGHFASALLVAFTGKDFKYIRNSIKNTNTRKVYLTLVSTWENYLVLRLGRNTILSPRAFHLCFIIAIIYSWLFLTFSWARDGSIYIGVVPIISSESMAYNSYVQLAGLLFLLMCFSFATNRSLRTSARVIDLVLERSTRFGERVRVSYRLPWPPSSAFNLSRTVRLTVSIGISIGGATLCGICIAHFLNGEEIPGGAPTLAWLLASLISSTALGIAVDRKRGAFMVLALSTAFAFLVALLTIVDFFMALEENSDPFNLWQLTKFTLFLGCTVFSVSSILASVLYKRGSTFWVYSAGAGLALSLGTPLVIGLLVSAFFFVVHSIMALAGQAVHIGIGIVLGHVLSVCFGFRAIGTMFCIGLMSLLTGPVGLAVGTLTPQVINVFYRETLTIFLLVVFVLPLANAVCDLLSLGMSRGLVRFFQRAPRKLNICGILTCTALDFIGAVGLVLLLAILIATGSEIVERSLEHPTHAYWKKMYPPLAMRSYDPWGQDLILTLMLLSPLFWKSVHFVILTAGVIFELMQLPHKSLRRYIDKKDIQATEVGRIGVVGIVSFTLLSGIFLFTLLVYGAGIAMEVFGMKVLDVAVRIAEWVKWISWFVRV